MKSIIKIAIALLVFAGVSFAVAGEQLNRPSGGSGGTYTGILNTGSGTVRAAEYLDTDGDGDIDKIIYDSSGDGIDDPENNNDDITFVWNETWDRYEAGNWWFKVTWQLELYGDNCWGGTSNTSHNSTSAGAINNNNSP